MIADLRFALRQLIKSPGFTIAAVLVLALGIGANTAVFSLVHTLLFAPPGYAKPHELVQIFSQDQKNPKTFRAFSYPTYTDVREQASMFSGIAAHSVAMVGLGEKGNTRRAFASTVSTNYFSVLGITPLQGRTFLPRKRRRGARRRQRSLVMALPNAKGGITPCWAPPFRSMAGLSPWWAFSPRHLPGRWPCSPPKSGCL